MTELSFECVDIAAQRYAASPTLNFRLRVDEADGTLVHALALRCQIRIEPRKRRYDDAEAELLGSLFGDRERWGESMQPIQFAMASAMVPGFQYSTEVDVPIACSYDLEVTYGQYFNALATGEVPLLLLFSGTVFGKGDNGFWVEPVPWHLEASYRLPVEVYRSMMEQYFPQQGWLRLHNDTIDELVRYKSANALPTWDAVMAELLAGQRVVT